MARVRAVVVRAIALAGVLSAALAAGCGTPAPAPEDRFYRLILEAPADRSPARVLPGTLAVARLRADGVTQSRAIAYVDAAQPLLVRQYHYHHWIEAPPRLVQEALVSCLRGAGVAAQVVAAATGPAADHLVEGTISRFEQLRGDGGSTASVSIELQLRHGPDGKLLLVKEYARDVPADGDGMHGMARAFSRAVQAICADFARDIGQ